MSRDDEIRQASELARARRGRNIAVALSLVGLMVLLFVMTLIRVTP